MNRFFIFSMQGKKGIWIKLPIELVNLVETVVKVSYSALLYICSIIVFMHCFANFNPPG